MSSGEMERREEKYSGMFGYRPPTDPTGRKRPEDIPLYPGEKDAEDQKNNSKGRSDC